ncbi:uncharacterized protein LY89DRAFT_125544 [Mollisia scopiformis]|uniref:Uncharacterized protein n=1 Tax=Mollisia scopiformis TaxID=149040 RepID=A0A194X437_MOLSC|nr:uncharacterized protein LY89DRAFT_125544 [Mollisia scopiformis]KUJ14931.1 hypothetical protein LY89DRAFT_125544 [Mollisia scopiformis]
MGIFRTLISTTVLGGAGTVGAFAFWTRNAQFVPLSPSDKIYSSAAYLFQNPNKNPATQDLCIRRVPLSKIKPQLLEKEKEGKLVEAFCAGVWSGWGYEVQRRILERKWRGDVGRTGHQLWDRKELRESKYDVGTEITDHFEVVEKDVEDGRIVVRCGDSPLNKEVRATDGLFEMSVKVDKEKGEAVFGLKSVLFQGLGKADKAPMPPHIEFLHRVYTKLWMETAVSNCVL